MKNELIRNDTDVYYTVQVKDGLLVTSADFIRHGNIVNGAMVRAISNAREANRFASLEKAAAVAHYVGGTVTKHTMTEVVTVVSEDIRIEGDAQ